MTTASRLTNKKIEEKHNGSFCEELILHKLSKRMHNHHNNTFKIEERRRKVASILAQSMTETNIESIF
jgi:hypothetical protein